LNLTASIPQKKQSDLYWLKCFFMTCYFVFLGNNALSITPIASIYGVFMIASAALSFLFVLIYLPDIFLFKKRFKSIDIIAILFCSMALYLAMGSMTTFHTKIFKAIAYGGKNYFYTLNIFFFYYLFRSRIINPSHYKFGYLATCWFNLLLYIYLMYTINPAQYQDTELVGYNPSKGGYVYNFPPGFIQFGANFYFLTFVYKKKYWSLFLWAALMSYIIFFDKGRILAIETIGAQFAFMIIFMPWQTTLRRSVSIVLMASFTVGLIYYFYPEMLDTVFGMFKIFFEMLTGTETGEASADSRFLQFATAFDFWTKHPLALFTGIGMNPKEDMLYKVGYINPTDTGIIGTLLIFGIIGTVLNYLFLIYPLAAFIKIKHFKANIMYNAARLSIIMVVIDSLFSGGFVYFPFGILNIFVIIDVFWREDKLIDFKLKKAKYEAAKQNN
jgi:hypothetical protein